MLALMAQGGQEMKVKLDKALLIEPESFEYRWAAD
jgi:hypothetical protein